MDTTKAGGKRRMNDDMAGEEEEEENADMALEDEKKRRGPGRKNSGGAPVQQSSCQVQNCTNDMSGAKQYHRRHKVCPTHAKVPMVVISGVQQRFCQQCSRFHELTEFDDTKKSCRRRLAGHNERRRKSSYENHGEGSGLRDP